MEIHSFSKSILGLTIIDSKSSLFLYRQTDGHTIAGMIAGCIGVLGAVLDNKFPGVTLYKL